MRNPLGRSHARRPEGTASAHAAATVAVGAPAARTDLGWQ